MRSTIFKDNFTGESSYWEWLEPLFAKNAYFTGNKRLKDRNQILIKKRELHLPD